MSRIDKATYVIAEAGVNHNGSLDMAKELIQVAAEAGADSVKFQTFKAETLAAASAPKADYQVQNMGEGGSQIAMLKKLELSREDHFALRDHAKKCGIEFLSSPFDIEAALFLSRDLALPRLKIPSGEITNAPFLLEIAKLGKPLILSTGMCTLEEIETALGVLAFGLLGTTAKIGRDSFAEAYQSVEGKIALKRNLCILHCTTEYPAPFDSINLKAMITLQESFGLPIGYSDHSVGISVPIAATAMGATVIEKHFTLNRNLPGPDHAASLEPSELRAMVRAIREVDAALGSAEKKPVASEMKNRLVARKSLVVTRDLKKGELLSPENLACKRPGSGISPLSYWEYLGRPVDRDLKKDDLL